MTADRSFRFTHAITRQPAASVERGLRAGGGAGPDPAAFRIQHASYVAALEAAGVEVTTLAPLEAYPDSVFVEDAALCPAGGAIVLRPGARSRAGEATAIRPALVDAFATVVDLPGEGFVDGGDVLLADEEAFVGLSARTDRPGYEALEALLADFGYRSRRVEAPAGVLHFKSDCGLLDATTVFATRRLAASGCFSDYRVIEAPAGEEAAANLIRINDVVLVSAGYPSTAALLRDAGYAVVAVAIDEAACLDGGLSCMSLRFAAGPA